VSHRQTRSRTGTTQQAGPRLPSDDYHVSYPSNWHRASTSLTPNLSDPHEILTVGTGSLPVGGPRCAQVPVNALEAVGATGALVSIQERAPAPPTAASRPARPDCASTQHQRLRFRPASHRAGDRVCTGSPSATTAGTSTHSSRSDTPPRARRETTRYEYWTASDSAPPADRSSKFCRGSALGCASDPKVA
jgi:hypothetical protein